MVKPMTTNMFGILEVKITARARKRGFTPWKAWRKHWCNLKKSASGVELAVYNTVPVPDIISIPTQTITIPETCVCYRTDSRSKSFAFGLFADSKSRKAVMYLAGFSESNSQEWITAIRKALDKRQNSIISILEPHLSYTVSLIDNAHSRAAGLFGIYGEMTVTPAGLIIHQPSGKFKHEEHLERFCINWNQILQCHLNNKGGEDERKICIVHTNELFPNGPGQLLIFCMQAPKLLHSIMTQCNKILTTKLSTPKQSNCDKSTRCAQDNTTKQNCDVSSKCENNISKNISLISYPACHRMSRSEGDLCGYCESDRDSGWSSCSPPEYNSMLAGVDQRNLTLSELRLSMSSEDSSFVLKGKVADSLISTGLLLRSLAKSGNDDDFQTNDMNFPLTSETIDPRRVSAVSVASGVYEEISESSAPCSLVTAAPLSALYEEPLYMPPPLPPRGRHTSHTSTSDDGIEDDDCDCTTPVTAKSIHPHLYNWNLIEKSQILSVSSPNVNSTQDARKFLMTSAKQQIPEADQNYENSITPVLDETNQISDELCSQSYFEAGGIPRRNTEPQQVLRALKINAARNNDLVRKSRNRFDLTPIRNKLNYFMKNRLDSDNTPKSKSHFYNSLPRSSNITKHVQNTPKLKQIFKNGPSRSCELLDCEEIEPIIPSVRSCDLLDCVRNSPISSHFKINANDNTNILKKADSSDSEHLDNNLSCDILRQPTKESNEPNFSQMRCEWTESRTSKNVIEFDYVPMSPNVIKMSEESNYMDMTGSKGRNISSTIINGSPKLDYGQI